mmetsp:Transcript_58514/g.104039  ORF Transcript_58514/g.104039 Transcript_58514/m.104039 type:complete len:378 (-) Transcript_58514:139-1272(-)
MHNGEKTLPQQLQLQKQTLPQQPQLHKQIMHESQLEALEEHIAQLKAQLAAATAAPVDASQEGTVPEMEDLCEEISLAVDRFLSGDLGPFDGDIEEDDTSATQTPVADSSDSGFLDAPQSEVNSTNLESAVAGSELRPGLVHPSLRRGQMIVSLLSLERYPSWQATLILDQHVEKSIKALIASSTLPTVTRIGSWLRAQQCCPDSLFLALGRMCSLLSHKYCFWVPLEGPASVVLLEEPLPPLEAKEEREFLGMVGGVVRKRLQKLGATIPPMPHAAPAKQQPKPFRLRNAKLPGPQKHRIGGGLSEKETEVPTFGLPSTTIVPNALPGCQLLRTSAPTLLDPRSETLGKIQRGLIPMRMSPVHLSSDSQFGYRHAF